MKGCAVGCPAFQTGNPLQDALPNRLVGKLKQDNEVQGSLELCQGHIKMLGLPDGPGKSIEEKTGSIRLHPRGHDTDDKLVGDKEPLAGPGVGFPTQDGSLLAFGA